MMSKLSLAIFVATLLAVLGTSTRASAQQPVSPYFFGMTMTGGEVGAEPWPVVPFSGFRLWDSGVPWSLLNPAPGTYDWRLLDIWMNHAKQNGVDIDYCFGRVPRWASSEPNDFFCANEPGSCDPPSDLNADGTGTNLAWRDFVTAIATHSAGRIHYWELWDEFPNPHRWHWPTNGKGTATIQQLLRMAQDARAIIKRVDPTAVIISHSGALRFAGDETRWKLWVQAGINNYTDILAFHSYVQPSGNYPPIPETLVGLLVGAPNYPFADTNGFFGLLDSNNPPIMQPIWNTEGSWAADIAGVTDADEQAGFLARFDALNLSTTDTFGDGNTYGPVQRFEWYEYDNTGVGALWQWITRWDLALPNANGNVSVMWGFGDGTFQPAKNHGTGSTPDAAASGTFDLKNDQYLDLVVADKASNGITLMLGNGDGTFEAGKFFAAGKSPVSVAVGDFNQDGNPDVVVANSTANTVNVLLGTGNCSPSGSCFQSPTPYSTQGSNPSSVVVADFNKDGYPDIAVTNAGSGTVSVLLNNGSSGGFTPASGSPYTVGNGPSSVAVADLTNDGYLDLAVTNVADGTVSVLLNNGSGSFTPASYSPLTVGKGPSGVAMADFKHTGYLDLAVANQTDGTVSVLLNNGSSGGFTQMTGSPFSVGKQPVSIATEDFDGDGYYDMVTANQGDGTVTTLMHCHTNPCKKAGTFFSPAQVTNVGSNPIAMAVGGFDVVGNRDPGTMLKPGFAYQNFYNWTVGNTINPACTGPIPVLQETGYNPNQGVWTCGIQGSNGFQGQLVWYMDETLKIGCSNNVCTTMNYKVPSGYTQYQTVYGQVYQVPKSGIVPIGYVPILLENHNPPKRHDIVRRKRRVGR
jgi:hypothetical protein